jgi:hypothetical protein
MSAARVMELLRALRTLELMRHHLATFACRHDTREAWGLVVEAIDDRCALLRGVLVLDADADILRECDMRLALEQAGSGDASTALDASPLSLEREQQVFQDCQVANVKHPRLTIH